MSAASCSGSWFNVAEKRSFWSQLPCADRRAAMELSPDRIVYL